MINLLYNLFMSSPGEFLDSYSNYLRIPSVPEETTEKLANDMLLQYEQPQRYHHNIDHIKQMAAFVVENKNEILRPREMMWKVLGHDLVYIPSIMIPGANEKFSADLTRMMLDPYLGERALERIGSDILSTATHKLINDSGDQAYLLDADLIILGSNPETFDQYDQNIRREYAFLTDGSPEQQTAFNLARLTILEGFSTSNMLFYTETAQEQFEEQAKENLERKINEYIDLTAKN